MSIAIRHRTLAAFLIVQDKLNSDPGIARPSRVRWMSAIPYEVSICLKVHDGSPFLGKYCSHLVCQALECGRIDGHDVFARLA